MEDRQSARPGRIKLTFDDGTVKYATLERADEPAVVGSPLNKNTLFNSTNTERFACNLPSEAFELLGKVWGPVTLRADGWSSAPDAEGYYTQRIEMDGMSAQYYPSTIPVFSSAELKDDEKVAFGSVDIIETYDRYIVCKSTFPGELDVNFVMVGV